MGNQRKLVIAVEAMSQICSQYYKGTPHKDLLYPKNYYGSLKGVEAEGAERIA
jgi:hypothetical protein